MPFPLTTPIPILTSATLLLLSLHRTHLLMALLTLECAILLLGLLVVLLLAPATQPSAFLLLVILTLGACEASLGLAILVSMSRSYGDDLVTSLSINKC